MTGKRSVGCAWLCRSTHCGGGVVGSGHWTLDIDF